jgi:hypothetical protein
MAQNFLNLDESQDQALSYFLNASEKYSDYLVV